MTISKKEKKRKRVLDSLEKGKLSNDKGKFVCSRYRLTAKQRRHSGRRYPKIFVPQRILDEEGIFVDYYWDDWVDVRDGFRDNSDMTHLYKKRGSFWRDKEELKKINEKQKKINERRFSKKKTFK